MIHKLLIKTLPKSLKVKNQELETIVEMKEIEESVFFKYHENLFESLNISNSNSGIFKSQKSPTYVIY